MQVGAGRSKKSVEVVMLPSNLFGEAGSTKGKHWVNVSREKEPEEG